MDKHTIAHLKTVMSSEQLIDFLADKVEAAEKLLVPWIERNAQMPDPKTKRRVCVFTPNEAADLRYRLVPADLFKTVCSSATHWHYVDDPVAPAGVAVCPPSEEPLERCAAARDGECHHKDCPQIRDNEPTATGRHCPIDNWDE
ncbi:TPA: hypothetical protein ACGTP8_000247 [Yersinia enterocolitica]